MQVKVATIVGSLLVAGCNTTINPENAGRPAPISMTGTLSIMETHVWPTPNPDGTWGPHETYFHGMFIEHGTDRELGLSADSHLREMPTRKLEVKIFLKYELEPELTTIPEDAISSITVLAD
jgi:hypothetical protein